jgi:TRAP transporter TAXI family solute receptor
MNMLLRLRPSLAGLLVLLFVGSFGATPAAAQETGIAAKKPIVAAACIECPWGTIADVLEVGLKQHGYDLQICYTCSRANNVRIVAGVVEPPPTDRRNSPPPPKGKVDFGITSATNVQWAYGGIHDYAGDPPRKNFRLIAFVEMPAYVLVAVKASSGITDLKQFAEQKKPIRVMTSNNAVVRPILDYYGLSKKAVESWGGAFVDAEPENRTNFDLIVYNGVYLGQAPEVNGFYEITAKQDLRYIALPDDLRQKLQADIGARMVDIPRALFRGVEKPVPTIATAGQVVYARDDTPDDFAYTLAKSLDEVRDRLRWTHMPLSYEPRSVAKLPGVPLHPGAERYYREVGYLK